MNMNILAPPGDSIVYLTQYKSYLGLVSQNGTDAPTALVLNSSDSNYIGDIVWTRLFAGAYRGILAGAFRGGKTISPPFGWNGYTMMPITSDNIADCYYTVFPLINGSTWDEDTICLDVYNADFSRRELSTAISVSSLLIEIRVYPA